jgi:hypothetical protein
MSIEIPSAYQSIKIVRKPEEKDEENMPNNMFEAMIVFHRANMESNIARCRDAIGKYLDVLAKGPDGKTKFNIGHGSVCWECGFVGIPSNVAEVIDEELDKFLPICKACGENKSNIVICVKPDGSTLPWIDIISEEISQP